ncbi:MAG: hypothetical protein H6741_29000 [Alphaproteobacteria bacterium]|nr:hypothetical protein [Alphaproteobacteria bacterium]
MRWLMTLACLLSVDAHAASVRLVLDRPLNLLSADSARAAQLDGALPAGESFNLDIPVPEGLEASGTLSVWPRTGDVCPERMPTQGPQRQVLGMSVATSEHGDRVLRARVAPLQVTQAYCLRIEPRMTLSGDALDSFAAVVADEIVHAASLPQARCPSVEEPEPVSAALEAAARATGLGDGEAVDTALTREALLAAQRLGGRSACDAVREQRIRAEQAFVDLNQLEEARQQALHTLGSLPNLPAPPSPYVLVDGRLVQVGALLLESPEDPELEQAAAQLRSCDLAIAPSCVAWAKRLEGVIGSTGSTRSRTMDQARRESLAAPPELNLYVSGGLRSLSALRSGAVPFDPNDLALQLEQLAATGADGGQAAPWLTTLRRLDRITDRIAPTREGLETARASLSANQDQLRSLWVNAVKTGGVAGRLIVDLGQISLGRVSSTGSTQGGVNYVTPVGGAAVALPSDGAKRSAWAAPYLGINIYSLPAERVIPLNDLASQQLRQRVSLTVGALIDPNGPPMEGYSVQPAFRNAYPLVAGNVRLMRHIGLTGGAVWVRVEDPNPASASTTLLAVPFVGATLDVDVIKLLTDTLGNF